MGELFFNSHVLTCTRKPVYSNGGLIPNRNNFYFKFSKLTYYVHSVLRNYSTKFHLIPFSNYFVLANSHTGIIFTVIMILMRKTESHKQIHKHVCTHFLLIMVINASIKGFICSISISVACISRKII